MAQLSSNDRAYLEIADQLGDLKRHPAWGTYEREVVDEGIYTLKNMLFNEELSDLGQVKGIRTALRAFYLIKGKPDEMMRVARDIRQELGMPEPEQKERVDDSI